MNKRGTMATTFNGATLVMALLILLLAGLTLRSIEAPQWTTKGITLETLTARKAK